jgi:sigma-B regulation protein RsbU (phosphoserine phosphatase)
MCGGLRPAEILRLAPSGPVLGVLAGARYEHGEAMVQAGDLLVIFSDGILEATNAHEQEFGEERLIAAIERNWQKPPVEICQAIFANINAFIGNGVPQDDQTLIIARLEPSRKNQIPPADMEGVFEATLVPM